VRRYAGKIHSWDVLNEPLNVWDKRPDLLAAHPWVDLIGPEYIDIAFHTAASADPHARLIWNQNYLESDDPGDQQNRDAMLVQLRRIKSAGVPIHGIGIESHLFAEKTMATSNMERFIGEVRSLGLEVQITELDVNDSQLPLNIERRDQMVADVYKRYLDLMTRIASPTVIAFWSYTDKNNWYDWAEKTLPRYGRPDGAPHRPGLLDADLREKPAYYAVSAALSR
jgi:endo-1,4-beta-xylanase